MNDFSGPQGQARAAETEQAATALASSLDEYKFVLDTIKNRFGQFGEGSAVLDGDAFVVSHPDVVDAMHPSPQGKVVCIWKPSPNL